MRHTDVVYGLWTVGQLLLGALGLLVFPAVIRAWGLSGVFAIIGLLSAALFATTRFYAPAPAGAPASEQLPAKRALWTGLFCLAGIFVYYAGQTAVWVYLERVGAQWQLPPTLIAGLLFVGLLAGIVGAGIAVLLGDKIGRRAPVAASLIVSAVSISLLLPPGGTVRFAVAACLFNLAWYLFLPYSAAVVASVDRGGKLLTGLGVVFPASLAAGPAFAALFVTDGDLRGAMLVGLLSIPIGLVGILPATREP